MAGSYGHVVADNGKLLIAEDFAQMEENLGDAFETVEVPAPCVVTVCNELGEPR